MIEKIISHGDFPLDLELVRTAVWVAAHCCLNGLVGINKTSTFLVENEVVELSIASLTQSGQRSSNKGWKNFRRLNPQTGALRSGDFPSCSGKVSLVVGLHLTNSVDVTAGLVLSLSALDAVPLVPACCQVAMVRCKCYR